VPEDFGGVTVEIKVFEGKEFYPNKSFVLSLGENFVLNN
jgi:hypothetical protein